MAKKCCGTCEFNFGAVCAGYGKRTDNGEHTYGSNMREMIEMFPDGCEDWGISLDAVIKDEKRNGR